MHPRFADSTGKLELQSLFSEQKLLAGIDTADTDLIDMSEVDEYPKGKQIYAEGERVCRLLYLVLGGKVELFQDGKRLKQLGRGEFFGEFPLLDPAATYAVSALIAETCLIAKVRWSEFATFADAHPKIWRNLAAELAHRLRGPHQLSPAALGQSDPKNLQEAVVQLASQLPRGAKVILGVLITLFTGLYLLWQSLPDASKGEIVRKLSGTVTISGSQQPPK